MDTIITECGTWDGYKRHAKRREKPCDPCRDVRRARDRDQYRTNHVWVIREWARAAGLPVTANGRLPAAVVAAYENRVQTSTEGEQR